GAGRLGARAAAGPRRHLPGSRRGRGVRRPARAPERGRSGRRPDPSAAHRRQLRAGRRGGAGAPAAPRPHSGQRDRARLAQRLRRAAARPVAPAGAHAERRGPPRPAAPVARRTGGIAAAPKAAVDRPCPAAWWPRRPARVTRPELAGVGTVGPAVGDARVREDLMAMDVIRIICAILLPPLGVFLQVGLGGQFWLNILLTLL